MHKDTYLFFPPEGLGERAASERVPVIIEASFNEACVLASGPYRGWRVFSESSIEILDVSPAFLRSRTVTARHPDEMTDK